MSKAKYKEPEKVAQNRGRIHELCDSVKDVVFLESSDNGTKNYVHTATDYRVVFSDGRDVIVRLYSSIGEYNPLAKAIQTLLKDEGQSMYYADVCNVCYSYLKEREAQNECA